MEDYDDIEAQNLRMEEVVHDVYIQPESASVKAKPKASQVKYTRNIDGGLKVAQR